MDCDGECAEWDIRNEFETVDGMPVYYGGDLYDSDDSDLEDPCDIAYAEYVYRYNLDAPEGFELKVFERSKAVDMPVMMVGEVTGPGHVCQKLSSCSLSEADMVCAEPVVDTPTGGHDVPGIAKSPVRQNSCETDGGGVTFYYEGDLSDSDCGSVGDQELYTWEDLCSSAFRNGYGGFTPDTDDPQQPVMFSGQLFWDEDIVAPSRVLPDCGDVPASVLQVCTDPVIPLIPPATSRMDRFDNNELEIRDGRIGESSVLSLGICYPSIDMNTLDGD